MISARNLTYRYPAAKADAIEALDLELPKGSFGFLVGPGGAGKSTFISLLLGGRRLDHGSLEVNGVDITEVRDLPAHRRSIGLVSEDVALLADRTVGENIMLPLELVGTPSSRAKERLVEILHRFGLDPIRNELPRSLSTGERRRTMLARALAMEPMLLILDEPALGLDPASAAALWDILVREHQRGMTILAAVSGVPDDPGFAQSPRFSLIRAT